MGVVKQLKQRRLDFRSAFEENVGVMSPRYAFSASPPFSPGIRSSPVRRSLWMRAGRHPISPDIYGINSYWDLGNTSDPQRAAHAAAALFDVAATVRRWGGKSTSTYHWKFDVNKRQGPSASTKIWHAVPRSRPVLAHRRQRLDNG
jgi:hypothetical protein